MFKTIFMKLLSTKIHGILDYIVGILLIAAPWLFGFAGENGQSQQNGEKVLGAETWVPVILGISAIVYSLFTNYEYGFVSRKISMKTHLTLDFISGIFLAASPWVFGFNEFVYLPHLILGILEIGAAAMTNPVYNSSNSHSTYNHEGRTSNA
jgi:hypothetical protein